jgi:hypothetical protein
LLVLAFEEDRAAEPRERREAQHGTDAVDVHVSDAGLGVITARDHVVVADRLQPVLLRLLTGDRVEPDVRVGTVLVQPGLHRRQPVAARNLDDSRAGVEVLRRQPVRPHLGMLDQVIVDGQQLHGWLQRHEFTPLRMGTQVR